MTGKIKARDIVLIGLMSAILLAVKEILAALPNVELVSLLIIVYSLCFGRRTLYIIYVFVLLEGLIYGFGVWWISYLYIWTILFCVVRLLKKNDHFLFWAFISGAFGLLFGALSSIPWLFILGPAGMAAGFIAGIPFDIAHCVGNFFAALILYAPLCRLMKKLV